MEDPCGSGVAAGGQLEYLTASHIALDIYMWASELRLEMHKLVISSQLYSQRRKYAASQQNS